MIHAEDRGSRDVERGVERIHRLPFSRHPFDIRLDGEGVWPAYAVGTGGHQPPLWADGQGERRRVCRQDEGREGPRLGVHVCASGTLPDGRRTVISTAMDVTERKRAEEEKAELEAQLQQAQKMESVGRLAGGVAHDFNNMLGVDPRARRAGPGRRWTRRRRCTQTSMEIRSAARRSADLTRQLLAFARKQTVAPKVLDLNETVAGMLDDAAAADRRGHRPRLAAGRRTCGRSRWTRPRSTRSWPTCASTPATPSPASAG